MFTKPYGRDIVVALAQTKQPFRDVNCYYRRYKRVEGIKERGGIEYVNIESVYENGMRPSTEMTMADAIAYFNNAVGLEFLPIYTL